MILGAVIGGAMGLTAALGVFLLQRYLANSEKRWLAAQHEGREASPSPTLGPAEGDGHTTGRWLWWMMTNAVLWGGGCIGYFVVTLNLLQWIGGNLGFSPNMPFVLAALGPLLGLRLATREQGSKR